MKKLIRIIDLETTGTDQNASICEVAAIDWTDTGSTVVLNTLVNPCVAIPAEASAVHHITDDMVSVAPYRAAIIPPLLGSPIYAAHKADFDGGYLPELSGAYWVCTYKVALRVIEDAPGYSLQTLRYHLRLGDPPEAAGMAPHRALYDAWCCERLLSYLAEKISIKEMVQISREPARLRRMPFGKHDGQAFSDLPGDYLDWIVRQSGSDFDRDVIFTAERELDRRNAGAMV